MTGCRSDDRVVEKVAHAAREYASEATRLGIVDVEKSCDDTKASKGTEKGHWKSLKVRVLGQSIQKETEDGGIDATLAAPEARQPAVSAALTESNKADRFIASEKKRKSDPLLVFDESRNEIQDPPEEYTAETLGEKYRNTYRWIITREVVSLFSFSILLI